MHAINAFVGSIVAALLWPFQSWTPLAGLLVVSLVAALGLLASFKLTSNQRALAAAKRRMQASLFELRLFQEDPRLVLRAVIDLLGQQAAYLRYALVPLLWIAIPLAVLLAHLNGYYGYDGLRAGQPALVKVRINEINEMNAAAGTNGRGSPRPRPRPPLMLDAPDGVRIETPGVWTPSLREMAWRITADRDGDYTLRLSWNDATFTKQLRVTPRLVAHAPIRPAASVRDAWLHPVEPPLPAGAPIAAIEVTTPARTIAIPGLTTGSADRDANSALGGLLGHWLTIFVVMSTLFALLCRRFFRVVL